MIYIHFEDGRDLAKLTTYKIGGRKRYTYQYENILFTTNRRLKRNEISEEIRKRVRLKHSV